MTKKVAAILFAIILLASVLRLWQLDKVPPSLDWDEVSWGYNAHSILQTGKDEYGSRFPIVLRSFDDYKPALYVYLVLPAISILGLSDFAVRFPNAVFGILTVMTTFFLVKEIFKRNSLALLSSFLMAISPWGIQFSRFAHEGMVGLEFNLLMILFFLKGLNKPIFLSLSALFAVLSLYSYQNEKVFVPLLGLVLITIYWRGLLKVSKKYLASAFLVGVFLSLPLVIFTFTNPNSFTRAKGASILNNPVSVLNTQFYPKRNVVNKQNNDFVGLVFDNRRVAYAKDIAENYLLHFDPNFLFIKGDIIPRHQPPGMGHLFLVELPFLLLGLFILIFGKFDKSIKKLIILWILIVPIPASLTWDVPNAGRTMNFLPTFQILVALGMISFFAYISKFGKILKVISYGLVTSLFLFNFIYYLNQYFIQQPYYYSHSWQYGYDKIISELSRESLKYGRIVVSTQIPLDQSYIFFLYHLKYPPEKYQKVSSNGTYKVTHRFDKYEFRDINRFEADSKVLYVEGANVFLDIPTKRVISRIKFLSGEDAYVIYTGK